MQNGFKNSKFDYKIYNFSLFLILYKILYIYYIKLEYRTKQFIKTIFYN